MYSGIPFSDAKDPPVVKEVVNILDMWSFVESSYEELTGEERAKLEKDAAPFGKSPRFSGFDGNNETEHMGVAMFLVNDLNRFSQFQGRSFNCHHPSLDSHRRMLAVFEPMRHRQTYRPLSLADLTQILSARALPSDDAE